MNERYIFRGRRIDGLDGWAVGAHLENKIGSYIIEEENPHECGQYHYLEIVEYARVDPTTIGQCTGLRDKHGKLIFEGDIVQHDGNSHEIGYMQKYAAFALKGLEYGMVLAWEYLSEIEIIGNIYDNPKYACGGIEAMEFNVHNSSERQVVCKDNEDNTCIFDDKASQHLEIRKVYTVTDVEVHSWHTRLTLKEIPNRQFRSSHFAEIEESFTTI